MRLFRSLLLVHVYLGLENPRSTILHLSRQSLNRRYLEILTSLPPNLSSPNRGSLKSPAITHGLLWRPTTVIKFCHKMHLPALLGLAHTAEKIQERLEASTFTSTWISCSVFASYSTSTRLEFQSSHDPPESLIVLV